MRRYKISAREISAAVGFVNHSVGVSIVVSARSFGRVRDGSTRHAGRWWCSSSRRSRRLRCRTCHANCAQTWINRGIESLPAAVDSTKTIGDANDCGFEITVSIWIVLCPARSNTSRKGITSSGTVFESTRMKASEIWSTIIAPAVHLE